MFEVGDHREVSEAAERLSGLVADLDLGCLLPSSLADLVAVGERIERLGHGLKTRAAAAVAQSAVWQGDGDRSPAEWLARQTGTSKVQAARTLDTARKLDALPATAAAVQRGELSAKQAEVIADAASVAPGEETRLLDRATHGATLRELQDDCRRTRRAADPDPDTTDRRVHAARSCRTWTDADGVTGHLHLSGPVATISRVDNAVRHRADKIFATARNEKRREPSEAYAFDAAVQLLTSTGEGTPVPAGADAKIIVRIDHSALRRGHAIAGETCEIAGIGPIPVSTVRDWMHDAFIAAVLTNGEDVQRVVHLGRRFTATQRTALQWHDPICARNGCTNRLRLEYDHLEDWAHTHTTRVPAAKRFCHPCHELKTRGWTVSPPDPDGQCTFTPPDPTSLAGAAAHAVTAQRTRRRGPRTEQPPLPDTG